MPDIAYVQYLDKDPAKGVKKGEVKGLLQLEPGLFYAADEPYAASVTKKQGNTVKSGEVIALAGNANTVQNSGATLHFELWKDGFPIDPTQFINFN
jgi:hypothetical protein